jgi:hypothetical protein
MNLRDRGDGQILFRAMSRWEFKYVTLLVGDKKRGDRAAIDRCQALIAEFGHDGWEPVGQLDFTYRTGGQEWTRVSQLMLKRQLPD